MKNVLATIIATLVATSAFAGGVFEQSSKDSSAALIASGQSLDASLKWSGTELNAFGHWVDDSAHKVSTEISGAVQQSVDFSGKVIVGSFTVSTTIGSFVLDVSAASVNSVAKTVQKAYEEGRKVNITIINPAAIATLAKGNLVEQSSGASLDLSNKSVETAGSVAVSILASSGELVVLPGKFTEEYKSARKARQAAMKAAK